MYRSQARVFSVGATTLLLAAALASGCGAGGGTGKPLAAFPTRADLAGIAQKTGPHPRIASDLIGPRDWQLEPVAPDARRPEHALLASATPHAKPSAALDCVAHELARLALDAPDKKPDLGLRRFISGRCGAVAALYAFQSWGADASLTDDAIVAQLRARLGKPIDVSATQSGVALARAGKRVSVVVVYGTPEVALDGFSQLVDADGVLQVRGQVLLDTAQLRASINQGDYGVERCVLDPAIPAPRFKLRCQLAPGDDYAWVQLLAIPRGRVLGHEVLGVLALRRPDAGTQYRPRTVAEARPVASASELQAAVLELVNVIRERAGNAPLRSAAAQSQVATSVTPAFFSALLSNDAAAQKLVDTISLGLLAGWDVKGGMIRGANLTVGLSVDALDAERWVADVLERPLGRTVLLDADARVLAIGAGVQKDPALLAGVAATYAFFEDETTPGKRALQVLERLGRVREARGLGRTVFVRDAPGVSEQIELVHAGKAKPMEALRSSMASASKELHIPVSGFVWETQDLDAIEFPAALLKKGELTLGAAVTYYRAPGGAWGQYAVLFVVIEKGMRA